MGTVGEPCLTGNMPSPIGLPAMVQPVSVCHQWSITGTFRFFSAQTMVSGSARSPARKSVRKLERSYFAMNSPLGSTCLMARKAVGAVNIAATLCSEMTRQNTPASGVFWRVISEHKVAAMFTAPTAFRAIKQVDPKGEFIAKYDLSNFRTLFLAGERADPDTIVWAEKNLKVPVIDHWWQTETGWTIAGNPMGLGMLPVKHGSPTVPMPGYEIHILDESNKQMKAGEIGAISIKLPLPPSSLPTLWNADERFREAYLKEYPGYYKTADAGYLDEDGY